MASINPYLTFAGTCREAMSFYRDCLDAELSIMTVGESPAAAQMPKESHGMVMHALLKKGALTLMASDMVGPGDLRRGNDIALMLYCSTEEEIRTFFPKLAAGGTINTDLREEFWGAVYGDITDKFGLRWMLNYDKPGA